MNTILVFYTLNKENENQSHLTEKCYEKRHAHVKQNTVEYGHGNHFLARKTGNGGQHHIHGIHSGCRYGSQTAEIFAEPGSAYQRHQFAENVGKQGNSAQLTGNLYTYAGFLELRDEQGRKGIIGEATAYGHTVGCRPFTQEQTGGCRKDQGTDDGGQGNEQQAEIEVAHQLFQAVAASQTDAHLKHQRIKNIGAQTLVEQKIGYGKTQAQNNSKAQNYKNKNTTFHDDPPF